MLKQNEKTPLVREGFIFIFLLFNMQSKMLRQGLLLFQGQYVSSSFFSASLSALDAATASAITSAPPDGDLFGAVAGGIFGFIGMLLFLVQNDQAGGTGGKHRRAGPYDHFRVAASDALPLVVPFPAPRLLCSTAT